MYAKAQFIIPRSVQAASDSEYVLTDMAAGESAVVYLSSSDKLAAYDVGATSDVSDFSDLGNNPHNKFQIMWRKYNTSDVVISTPELSLAELVDVKVLTSDSGNVQTTTVTPTVTSPSKGDAYSITLIDSTPGTANLDKWNFEVLADATDYSVADLLDAWTAAINLASDTTKITATDGTTVLTLAGTTTVNHFRVAVDGGDSATAVISYATDVKPATGAYATMVQMEKDMKSHGEGITNSLWFPKPWTSELESSSYLLGVFKFKLNKPAKHGMNATNTEDYTLYIGEKGAGISLSNWLKTVWDYAK